MLSALPLLRTKHVIKEEPTLETCGSGLFYVQVTPKIRIHLLGSMSPVHNWVSS